MFLRSAQVFLAGALMLPAIALAEAQHFPLDQYVSEERPAVVLDQVQQRYVESVDVNWRGATGRTAVQAEVLADGELVWSGLIPAYDPTFRAAIRARVSSIELRVKGGSAYVNWAKVYFQAGSGSQRGNPPEFIGELTDAAELARELIGLLAQLEPTLGFDSVRAHLLPLKKAAARVFSVSASSGGMRRIDVYRAVYGLEQVFQSQEPYFQGLLESRVQFEAAMGIMTVRERYRALFGKTEYPGELDQ